MLNAVLSRVRCFLLSDASGNMPSKRQADTLRFLHDGEIGVPRKTVIDLHKVCPHLLEGLNRATTVICGTDRYGMFRMSRMRAVHDWAAGYHSGPEHSSGSYVSSPLEDVFGDAAHVPHCQHSVRNEHREITLRCQNVNVHVPQARHEELASPIELRSLFRNLTLACLADGKDFPCANQHRHFRLRRFTIQIDDSNVCYRHRIGADCLLGPADGN